MENRKQLIENFNLLVKIHNRTADETKAAKLRIEIAKIRLTLKKS